MMENDVIIKRNEELFAELKKYAANTKAYQDTVGKIMANNARLVTAVAKNYFSYLERYPLTRDDLIAEGNFGLLNAIKAYEAEKGKFSTFAAQCIKNEILRCLTQEQRHWEHALHDNLETDEKQPQKEVADAVVNVEDDIIKREERQQQMAWLRKNLNQLPDVQKQVLTTKYLSGKGVLTDGALAKEFEFSRQYSNIIKNKALANLKKMYYEPIVEETGPKGMLKNLILTKLPPKQKKTMLCKFYSPTPKNNKEVAQEIDLSVGSVKANISIACRKLCKLCASVQDTKHLKSILESRPEASEVEVHRSNGERTK